MFDRDINRISVNIVVHLLGKMPSEEREKKAIELAKESGVVDERQAADYAKDLLRHTVFQTA